MFRFPSPSLWGGSVVRAKKKEKGNEHLKGPGEFSDGNYFPLSYKVVMTHFDSFFLLYQFWEFKRVVNPDILKAAAGVFKVADESLNVLFGIYHFL